MIELIRDSGLYMLLGEYPAGPLGGLALTLVLSACCIALVLPLAILVALARTSGKRYLEWPAAAYVNSIRCVPVLLIIFWIYLGAPGIIGFPLSGFTTIIIAITMYQTAFLSEVIRAGIVAIPTGQIESAKALGLSWFPIVWRIVLPQVVYNVSPGILNVAIIIIKETSLGYMVGVGEMTLTASHVNSMTLTKPMEVFTILAATYFVICYSLSRFTRALENRVSTRLLTAQ